jgi:uncharacterized protein
MKFKTLPAAYKSPPALLESDDRIGFEAIVSVFNNVDHGGDVVRPGAFKNTIAAWKTSGDPIPVLWSHRMDDPNYNIGSVTDIDELGPGDERIPRWANSWVQENGGLWVKASLDDTEHGHARQVRHLLKTRRVTQFSFAYDVLDERPGKDGSNELLDLWLYEVGPTPLGMNPLTELTGAKSGGDDTTAVPPTVRPTAADIRLRCAIAAMWHEHTDYQSR